MKRKKWSALLKGIMVGFIAVFVMASANADTGDSAKGNEVKGVIGFEGSHAPVWQLKAGSPLLIGGYGDNFSYNGSRVTPLLGSAEVILDAENDTGTGIVKIQGTINPEKGKSYSGDIMLVFRVKKSIVPFQEGGVADFVYLHGNTKQDAPVMPKTRTYLGAWGEMDVYVNGVQVYENLMGHIMYTERTRDTKTRAIYNKDKSDFFSHKDPANGSIAAPAQSEIHFVVHSMMEDKGNFPPHSVWIHLNFGDVSDLSGAGVDCGCGPGCTTLLNCSCGPNCTCPKDGKGGCGCSIGCNTGCAKGGACPLPKPLGT